MVAQLSGCMPAMWKSWSQFWPIWRVNQQMVGLSLSLFSPLPLPSLFSFFPSFSLSIIKKFKNLNQKKQTYTLRCDIIFSLDICLVIISVTNFHQQLSFYLFLVKIWKKGLRMKGSFSRMLGDPFFILNLPIIFFFWDKIASWTEISFFLYSLKYEMEEMMKFLHGFSHWSQWHSPEFKLSSQARQSHLCRGNTQHFYLVLGATTCLIFFSALSIVSSLAQTPYNYPEGVCPFLSQIWLERFDQTA